MPMRKHKRRWIALGIVAGLALAGGAAWRSLELGTLVDIGVGYTSQLTCACLFISNRPLDSCRMDLDPLARKLIGIHPGERQVTATSFGLARATARFDPEYGCSVVR
jgi:hypothetical protein